MWVWVGGCVCLLVRWLCLTDGFACCCSVSYIEQHGLTQEGIYRLSGSAARITELQRRIDAGGEVRFDPQTANIHDACGLLKLYLRQLPEGVLSAKLYRTFFSLYE